LNPEITPKTAVSYLKPKGIKILAKLGPVLTLTCQDGEGGSIPCPAHQLQH